MTGRFVQVLTAAGRATDRIMYTANGASALRQDQHGETKSSGSGFTRQTMVKPPISLLKERYSFFAVEMGSRILLICIVLFMVYASQYRKN